MGTEQVRPITFVEGVLIRPKMYTVLGTVGEVVSFLNGYLSGIPSPHKDERASIEWHAFGDWFREPFGGSTVQDSFRRFIELYGNDEEGLAILWDLFSEFREGFTGEKRYIRKVT